jgi:hypothetical protein
MELMDTVESKSAAQYEPDVVVPIISVRATVSLGKERYRHLRHSG